MKPRWTFVTDMAGMYRSGVTSKLQVERHPYPRGRAGDGHGNERGFDQSLPW